MKLRKEGKHKVVKQSALVSTSPSKVNEVLNNMEKEVETSFSPAEELNIIIKNDLNKSSYVLVMSSPIGKF